MMDNMPNLVFADKNGNIMDFEGLAMVGRSGDYFLPMGEDDVIDLPKGSQLYVIPDRYPVGFDRQTGEIVILEKNPYDGRGPVFAVAAFLPAAYTQTYLSPWERCADACLLPLFSYTALGFKDGFVTTAVRTDESLRQDPDMFDMDRVRTGVRQWESDLKHNRLVSHLSHCALTYGCPAAINMFLSREEGPLPSSPTCNARCLGCISYQPAGGPPSPQQRISFIPSPEEIAEIAIRHIDSVDEAVVSFGQGCEGEPLLCGDVLRDAILLIRKHTSSGTINLNTNASLPLTVADLADAGLDSMRISMNSALPETYRAYFRPGYDFDSVVKSAYEMKRRGRFVSINLFVFPGLTDSPKEVEALNGFIDETGVDMIQWRNLNIDPDVYLETLQKRLHAGIGVRKMIDDIHIRRGYFNPYIKRG